MSLTAREELDYRREIESGVDPRRELQIRRALTGKTARVETPEKSFMQHLVEMNPQPASDMTHALMGTPTTEQMVEQKELNRGMGIRAAKGVVGTGQGVKQLSLSALEGMNIIPKGSAEAYTKKTDEEKKLFSEEFNKEFGDRWQFSVAEGGGAIVPILATGGLLPTAGGITSLTSKVLPKAAPKVGQFLSTVKGQMAVGGLGGAMFGATQYVPKDAEESRLTNTLEGTAWGIGITGVLNTFPALKNKFRDFLGKAISKTEAKKVLALGKRTGHDFKLTQVTDDPLAKVAEDLTGATIAGERAAGELASKQIKQNIKFWQRTMRKFSKGKENFGTKLDETFQKVMGDATTGKGLLGARAKQAKADYAAVDQATGNKKVIPLTNFYNKTIKLVKENRLSSSPEKRKFAKALLAVAKNYRTGKVNGKQLQDLLQTYGSGAKGSGRIWSDLDPSIERSMSKAIFGSLQKDLSAASKSNIPGAAQLKIARDRYAKNSDAIRELQESALFKMFKKEGLKDAETLEKTFVKMTSGEMKGVMNILNKADPSMKGRLQKFWLQNQIDKSAKTAGFDTPIFQPHKMLELTSGAGRKTFKAIYDTAESRRMVMDGINATRRIIVANAKTSAAGGSFLQKMAGVAASRDPTFVARLTAEILAPKTVAAYVHSRQGVSLLKTLAKTNDVTVGAGILIRLNNLRKEQEGQDGN